MNKLAPAINERKNSSLIDGVDAIKKRQKIYKRLCYVFFIIFVLIVFAFTIYDDFFSKNEVSLPFSELILVLQNTWFYLIFAFLCLALSYLLKGLKLSVLCKAETNKWHFTTCMGTGVVGHYYNYITPLAVGGQPFEIYHLSKSGISGGVAYSLPVATYILNQIAFVFLGITAIVLYNFKLMGFNTTAQYYALAPQLVTTLAIIGCCFCLIMPLIVLMFSILPRASAYLVRLTIGVGNKLKIIKNPQLFHYKTMRSVVRNAKSLKDIAKHPWAFIFTFLLGFGETFAHTSIAYFTLKFFGFNWAETPRFFEWLQVVMLVLMISFAVSFIPTPGNSGAADFSFYSIFKSQLNYGLAFPAMLTWRIISFYTYIIIGFIFTKAKKRTGNKKVI